MVGQGQVQIHGVTPNFHNHLTNQMVVLHCHLSTIFKTKKYVTSFRELWISFNVLPPCGYFK